MKIAIFGSGGVGGYFGGLLARAGHEVAFIARGPHLRVLRENGLKVRSVHGDFDIPHVFATDDPIEFGPTDLTICTIKTYDIGIIADTMHPLIGPQTALLPLQNGVETPDLLAQHFGPCVGRGSLGSFGRKRAGHHSSTKSISADCIGRTRGSRYPSPAYNS